MNDHHQRLADTGAVLNVSTIHRLTHIPRDQLADRLRDIEPAFDTGNRGKFYHSSDALTAVSQSNALEEKRRHDAEMSRIKVAQLKRQLIPLEEFREEIESLCVRLMEVLRRTVTNTSKRNEIIEAIRQVTIPEEIEDEDE